MSDALAIAFRGTPVGDLQDHPLVRSLMRTATHQCYSCHNVNIGGFWDISIYYYVSSVLKDEAKADWCVRHGFVRQEELTTWINTKATPSPEDCVVIGRFLTHCALDPNYVFWLFSCWAKKNKCELVRKFAPVYRRYKDANIRSISLPSINTRDWLNLWCDSCADSLLPYSDCIYNTHTLVTSIEAIKMYREALRRDRVASVLRSLLCVVVDKRGDMCSQTCPEKYSRLLCIMPNLFYEVLPYIADVDYLYSILLKYVEGVFRRAPIDNIEAMENLFYKCGSKLSKSERIISASAHFGRVSQFYQLDTALTRTLHWCIHRGEFLTYKDAQSFLGDGDDSKIFSFALKLKYEPLFERRIDFSDVAMTARGVDSLLLHKDMIALCDSAKLGFNIFNSLSVAWQHVCYQLSEALITILDTTLLSLTELCSGSMHGNRYGRAKWNKGFALLRRFVIDNQVIPVVRGANQKQSPLCLLDQSVLRYIMELVYTPMYVLAQYDECVF